MCGDWRVANNYVSRNRSPHRRVDEIMERKNKHKCVEIKARCDLDTPRVEYFCNYVEPELGEANYTI